LADNEVGPAFILDDQGRGLARASALILSATAASLVIGLLRSKLIAVLGGPSGVAVFANLNLLLSSAALLAGGVAGAGAVRALAAARATSDNQTSHWLARYVFVAPAIVGLVFAVASYAMAGPLADLLLGDEAMAWLVVIVSLAIPIAVAANSYTVVLEASLKVASIARAEVLTGLVSIPLIGGALIAWGLPGAAAAIGAAFAARLAFLYLGGRDVMPRGDWLAGLRGPRGAVLSIVQLGAAAAVVALAATLGSLLVRAVIVERLGLETAGLYQPAAQLSETYVDVVLASLSVYLFPRLTQLATVGDDVAVRRELLDGLRISLAVIVPVVLLAIGFSSGIVGVLFSPAFEPAAEPLVIQIAGTPLKVMAWALGLALVPLGHPRAWAGIAIFTVFLRVLGAFVAVPLLGLNGAAAAWDVAWSVALVLTLIALRRNGRVLLGRSDGLYGATAAVMIVVLIVIRPWSLPAAAVGSVAAAIAWCVLARDPLRQLISALRTR
jgi:PST family polysaccharide transporter